MNHVIFGIMFFSDPVAAFANVRRSMKPGGRLTLAVFRPASETLWPNAPLEAVRHLLPQIPVLGPEEPGPFSWADPTRVRRILEGAGFSEVSLTPIAAAGQGPVMGVFNNLVLYKRDVPQIGLQSIVPDLASEWSWDEDKTQLTLRLRAGVKWHDGKPFSAKDV